MSGYPRANYLHTQKGYIVCLSALRAAFPPAFLTAGMMNPGNNNSRIWAIAWPMMLSGMSVPLLGLVDTALLGHLDSERYLGAIAIGANFIGLMYWSFGFLRMSTTGLIAIEVGKRSLTIKSSKQEAELEGIVVRSMFLGLLLGSLVCLLIPLFAGTVIHWMQASESVAPLAREYIEIRKYSAPAVFMTFAVSGWLIGTQQARKALALVLTTNLSNIVLDIWFIVYLDWGSAGAARATLIAEWLGLGLGSWFLLRHGSLFSAKQLATIGQRWQHWLRPAHFRDMLGVNYHLLVRTVLLLFVFNFFTAQGSGFGDSTLAANAILLQLVLFCAFVTDGFSFAAEALCGEAWGANRRTQLNNIVNLCFCWAGGATLCFVVVYFVFPSQIIGLLTDLSPVTATAMQFHYWMIAVTATGFVAYIMDGVFIGISQTRAMHHSMLLSTLLVFLPCWWYTRSLDNHGLWLAYFLFTIARGISLGSYWLFSVRAPAYSAGST